MIWLLKRIDDGKFVAQSGSKSSYTRNVEHARVFKTRQDADANACGNEIAITLEDLVGRVF